ncbi:hypothetical protein J41TS4_41800 [Paenibacillus apis]|uniref:Uncharacterized protein n=1 Tax=Paenibacillus apis TaxID=1792174 RepID=A0A919Y9A5_9BACL|nr:hypothetical protein J41TS4_41800 [Paenibacillus apis]
MLGARARTMILVQKGTKITDVGVHATIIVLKSIKIAGGSKCEALTLMAAHSRGAGV